MHLFFEELRNARLARGITLEEIEEKTRIGMQFLTALEEGNTSVLPGPYVRAFLREYAQAVGLDVDDTLRRFGEATGIAPPPPNEVPTFDEHSHAGMESPDKPSGSPGLRPWTKIALGAGSLLALLVLVWLLMPQGDRRPVQEIPFDRAIKEAEGRVPTREAPPAEARVTSPSATGDSLTLVAQTSDIVWIQVAVDNQGSTDLLLQANQQATWRARERFTVTVGNAGGIQFKLGSKNLEPIGKPGQVVRNVTISRSGVHIP